MESCNFWIALVSFTCAFVDDANVGIFYLFLGLPFVSITMLFANQYRERKILTRSLKDFKRDTELELYLIHLIHLIDNRNIPQLRV